MKNVIKDLTDAQFDFIKNELGFDKSEVLDMSEDEIYEKVYDAFCVIEEIETVASLDNPDEGMSERGEMASVIVTALGNTLAE